MFERVNEAADGGCVVIGGNLATDRAGGPAACDAAVGFGHLLSVKNFVFGCLYFRGSGFRVRVGSQSGESRTAAAVAGR